MIEVDCKDMEILAVLKEHMPIFAEVESYRYGCKSQVFDGPNGILVSNFEMRIYFKVLRTDEDKEKRNNIQQDFDSHGVRKILDGMGISVYHFSSDALRVLVCYQTFTEYKGDSNIKPPVMALSDWMPKPDYWLLKGKQTEKDMEDSCNNLMKAIKDFKYPDGQRMFLDDTEGEA